MLTRRLPDTDVLTIPRYPDLPAYQRAFDAWRTTYNFERPHEARGLSTPNTRYDPSPRTFPEVLPPVDSEAGDLVRTVGINGMIWFQNHTHTISRALVGQRVGVRPTTTDGVWEVRYCHVLVRTLDERGPRPPLIESTISE